VTDLSQRVSASEVPVAGIVASAGGLEAFQRMLAEVQVPSGLAWVLVPHLDPTHESLMVELLARQTTLPVVEITDGMLIETDKVFVIPPNKFLTLRDGLLQLRGPVEASRGAAGIDLFLRSLAEQEHERAIGIVLSGTGSYGSLGLREIKSAGGLAIAQDPATAAYASMPEAAIATGIVDMILSPEQIPSALADYVRQAYFRRGDQRVDAEKQLQQLDAILSLMRTRMQHDFSGYRKKTLLRRIERRMGLTRVADLDEYLSLLKESSREVGLLAKDLLISVTNFFRDPEAFRILEQEVIPVLLQAKRDNDPVRVWVPATASGEEPYSLAMSLLDSIAASGRSLPVQIFATDIDEDALTAARKGVYPESISNDVGPERLARYFQRSGEHSYQIVKPLREVVTFAMQNVTSDAPFSRMDLISCRNLLIYLEPEQQQKVIALFHFALQEGGYLLLGASETIGRSTELFEPVSKKWRIYRRIGPANLSVPTLTDSGQRPYRMGHELAPLPRGQNIAELTQKLLLAEFAPAAVLINRANQVLYYHGPTMHYLDQPTGEPTRDLVALARPGIHAKLRSLIGRARRDKAPASTDDARLLKDDGHSRVRLTCLPVLQAKASEELMLVTFEELAEAEGTTHPGGPTSSPLADEMERELDAIRADLQSTISELESSNEELKSANEEMTAMNEELQSVNEELETSREELQSLNEELTTVNGQLSEKVDEVEYANNDLANLFNSTDTATLFLSAEGRIRRFTPAATKLFHLIAGDIGRPIDDLSHSFLNDHLRADVGAVLAQLTPLETEAQSEDGRWFIRRILPYRTLDNRIEGVVVTFADVTTLKQAEIALRRNRQLQRLATVVTDSNDAITVQSLDGKIISWNRGAEAMYGYPESQALTMTLQEIVPEAIWRQESELFIRLGRGESVRAWQTQRVTKDGTILDVDLTATPLYDETEKLIALSTTERDITAAKEMSRHMNRLAEIVASSEDAIIGKSLDGTITDWNSGAERMYGYPAAAIVGQSIARLSPQKRSDEIFRLLQRVAAGDAVRHFETVHLDQDGQELDVSLTISPIKDATGAVVGAATIARDITDRKVLERQVLEIADDERRRIGQDLHDETGQELTGLGLIAQTLAEKLTEEKSPASELALKMAHGIQRATAHVRVLSRGLIPVEIDAGGLAAALGNLATRVSAEVGVACTFVSEPPVLVDDNIIATHLYRIAQEAVSNALKHGKPRRIGIELRREGGRTELEINDDGAGFRQRTREAEGLGLRIMRHRAAMMHAELHIEANAGPGVRIRCVLEDSTTPRRDVR